MHSMIFIVRVFIINWQTIVSTSRLLRNTSFSRNLRHIRVDFLPKNENSWLNLVSENSFFMSRESNFVCLGSGVELSTTKQSNGIQLTDGSPTFPNSMINIKLKMNGQFTPSYIKWKRARFMLRWWRELNINPKWNSV